MVIRGREKKNLFFLVTAGVLSSYHCLNHWISFDQHPWRPAESYPVLLLLCSKASVPEELNGFSLLFFSPLYTFPPLHSSLTHVPSSLFLSIGPLYISFLLISSLLYFSFDCYIVSRSNPNAVSSRCFASISAATSPLELADIVADVEPPEVPTQDTVEHLLTHSDDVSRLMKMERRPVELDGAEYPHKGRWFPYLDKYSFGSSWLNSGEILEALDSLILDTRKERFKNVVRNRSYSVCLVVEGLSDFGNVSAAFRSADALGFQSVHVVSCDASKRCNNHGGEIVFECIWFFISFEKIVWFWNSEVGLFSIWWWNFITVLVLLLCCSMAHLNSIN